MLPGESISHARRSCPGTVSPAAPSGEGLVRDEDWRVTRAWCVTRERSLGSRPPASTTRETVSGWVWGCYGRSLSSSPLSRVRTMCWRQPPPIVFIAVHDAVGATLRYRLRAEREAVPGDGLEVVWASASGRAAPGRSAHARPSRAGDGVEDGRASAAASRLNARLDSSASPLSPENL
jgi:hypothetical protein